MNRRAFLTSTAALAAAAPTQRPPNLVLLISDDYHWADYGFMGHPTIRTPRLDRLARESVLFTRGYDTAPLCSPSLASILTGLHPHQHKITSNDPPRAPGAPPWSPERLALRRQVIDYFEKSPTLPRMLAPHGYSSYQAGKWWGGHYSRGGFSAGMTHGDPARGGRHGDAGLEIGRTTMQPVFDFIDQAGRNPFFLWFAPMMPHSPHTPPQRLLDYYRSKTGSIHIARYWAMCEWWDEVCGQLIDHLDARGLASNTLIAYLSDNGWIQQPDSPQFAPRSKRSRFDGGVRTPLMLRWPGRLKPFRDDKTPVSAVDLAPTFLRAAGLTPPAHLPGVSLLDPAAARRRNTVFGAVYTHDAHDIHQPLENLENLWVVEGEWKLILAAKRAEEQSGPELFNLIKDPHEHANLAAAEPRRVARLRRRIQAWWPEGAAATRGA